MKIIFLDVDGVLNCQSSVSHCGNYVGIDADKVNRLKLIVDVTNAKLVLCSTWKSGWERVYKEQQDEFGNYLDKKLRKEHLYVMDKTDDYGKMRGEGILDWLSKHQIENWIILDDEPWDYEGLGIQDRVVRTEFENDHGGLQDEHVRQAIRLLRS